MAAELVQRDWIDYLGVVLSVVAIIGSLISYLKSNKEKEDGRVAKVEEELNSVKNNLTLLKNDHDHNVKITEEHKEQIKEIRKESQETFKNLSTIILKYLGRDREED